MGCFSFRCQECGKPINSSSFRGERCILSLLEDGLVIETMQGEYDSYGRVFDEEGNSIKWKSYPWSNIHESEDFKTPEGKAGTTVCSLMFKKEKNNGIAAVHEKCYTGITPTKRSKDDPNQGWGEFHPSRRKFKP